MEILHWDPFYVPAHLERAILFAREARWPDVIGEAAFVTRNADDTTMLRTAHSFLARAFHGASQDRKARTEELWIEAH